jgi:hypothetical protein
LFKSTNSRLNTLNWWLIGIISTSCNQINRYFFNFPKSYFFRNDNKCIWIVFDYSKYPNLFPSTFYLLNYSNTNSIRRRVSRKKTHYSLFKLQIKN